MLKPAPSGLGCSCFVLHVTGLPEWRLQRRHLLLSAVQTHLTFHRQVSLLSVVLQPCLGLLPGMGMWLTCAMPCSFPADDDAHYQRLYMPLGWIDPRYVLSSYLGIACGSINSCTWASCGKQRLPLLIVTTENENTPTLSCTPLPSFLSWCVPLPPPAMGSPTLTEDSTRGGTGFQCFHFLWTQELKESGDALFLKTHSMYATI